MGLTVKERQARCREKLRNDKDAQALQLEKDRTRKALQREKAKDSMSKKELEDHLFNEKVRIRNYREKQRSGGSGVDGETVTSPYRSNQAMGKAVKRTKTSLPTSPRKRLCIVQAVAKSVGLSVKPSSVTAASSHGALSESTK